MSRQLEGGNKPRTHRTLEQQMDRGMLARCWGLTFLSTIRVVLALLLINWLVRTPHLGLYIFVLLLFIDALFTVIEIILLLRGAARGELARMVSTLTNYRKLPSTRRFAFITHNKPFADWHAVTIAHVLILVVGTFLTSLAFFTVTASHWPQAVLASLQLFLGAVVAYVELTSFYNFVILGPYREVMTEKRKIAYGASRSDELVEAQMRRMTAAVPIDERAKTIRTMQTTTSGKKKVDEKRRD